MTLTTTCPVPDAKSLSLMLRPERVRLLDGKPEAGTNVFDAKVSELVYQGESFLLYAALTDGTELAVRGAIRSDTFAGLPRPGEMVKLGLGSADTVIIAGEEG